MTPWRILVQNGKKKKNIFGVLIMFLMDNISMSQLGTNNAIFLRDLWEWTPRTSHGPLPGGVFPLHVTLWSWTARTALPRLFFHYKCTPLNLGWISGLSMQRVRSQLSGVSSSYYTDSAHAISRASYKAGVWGGSQTKWVWTRHLLQKVFGSDHMWYLVRREKRFIVNKQSCTQFEIMEHC